MTRLIMLLTILGMLSINTYAQALSHEEITEDHINKAIEFDPNEYYDRGIAYYEIGKYEQARKDFTKIIERYPDHTDTYLWRGIAYYELGKYKQAIEDYTKIIERYPDYADTYFYRGAAYFQLGKYEEAKKDFRKKKELLGK